MIGDWLAEQEHQFMQYFIDKLEAYSGPTIPDKPVSEWLQQWWLQVFGEVLAMTSDSSGGGGS